MHFQMQMCLSCDTLTLLFMRMTALQSQHATNMRCFQTLIFSQCSHHHKSYWQHVNQWSVGRMQCLLFGNMYSPALSLCERSPLKCSLFWLQLHISWLLNCLPTKLWMCFLWVTGINWAASHRWHWRIECQLVFCFFLLLIAVQKFEFESLQALRILKWSSHTVRCIMTSPTETELPTIYATHHSSITGRRRGSRLCCSTLCSSGSPTPPLNVNCLSCLISVNGHPAKGKPPPKKTWKWNTLYVCSSLTSWYLKWSCAPLRKGVQRGWGSVYV